MLSFIIVRHSRVRDDYYYHQFPKTKQNGTALSSPEVTAVSHWMICQLEFESCLNPGGGGRGRTELPESTAWNPAVGHRGVFAQLGTELTVHKKNVWLEKGMTNCMEFLPASHMILHCLHENLAMSRVLCPSSK